MSMHGNTDSLSRLPKGGDAQFSQQEDMHKADRCTCVAAMEKHVCMVARPPSTAPLKSQLVKTRDACCLHRNNPPVALLHPSFPDHPWTRLHVDFAGPFKKWMCMAYNCGCPFEMARGYQVESKFNHSRTNYTSVLSQLFARFGLPKQLVSDNGFNSRQPTSKNFVSNEEYYTYVRSRLSPT